MLDVADGEEWPIESEQEAHVLETNENSDEDSSVDNTPDKTEATENNKADKSPKTQDDNTKSKTDPTNEKPIEVEWDIDDDQQDSDDNGQIKIF